MRPAWLLICILLVTAAFGQGEKQIALANRYFSEHNYSAAAPLYEKLLVSNQHSPLLNYRAGICFLKSRSQRHKAIGYLEKAAGGKKPEVPSDILKSLGDAYFQDRQFDRADTCYSRFLRQQPTADADLAVITERINLCRSVSDLSGTLAFPLTEGTGLPCPGAIKNVEYTCTPAPDKSAMFYMLRIPLADGGFGDARFFEGFVAPVKKDSAVQQKSRKTVAKKQSQPKPVIERDTVFYEATIASSVDGHAVLTYRNEDGKAAVFFSRLEGNRWSKPLRLLQPENPGGWEANEYLTPDGSQMFFASDRPGGYGGFDIYKCTRLADGKWSKAVNLGPSVNTAADEVAPYVHPDGNTMMFSSNRVKRSSYDVFLLVNGDNSKPVNVGYAVNSNSHDIFQITAENRKSEPLASGQHTGSTENKKGPRAPEPRQQHPGSKNDEPLFPGDLLITFLDQNKKPVTMICGKITEGKSGAPVASRVSVLDNKTGTQVAVFHAASTGEYAFALPDGKDCMVLFECDGYIAQCDRANTAEGTLQFNQRQPVSLAVFEEGSATPLKTILFSDDGSKVTDGFYELRRLAAIMKSEPYLKAQITALSYTKNDRRARKRLLHAKADAIVAALKEEGIPSSRIETEVEVEKPKKSGRRKKSVADAGHLKDENPDEQISFAILKNEKPT